MEGKKNNCLAVVIVLLVLVILGLVFYILYDKGIIFSNGDSGKDVNTTETTNTSSNNTYNTNEKSTTSDEVKELDLTKSLNTSGITYKNATDTEGNYGLSMKINSDKRSATLTIDWAIFGKYSTTGSSGEVKNYSVKGFSKNIKSTFVGDLGQDSRGITLFFIMEDGTVEYVKLFKQAENSDGSIYYVLTANVSADGSTGDFTSNGLVSGVKDVIKLYNVDTYSQNASGYRTVIGSTKDGSFYDLGSIINK